jgi:LysW-gamma-L-lysine carboxypeptidase
MRPNDLETLSGLVARYSPSGQEQGAVAWLVERMQALGFDHTFIDPAGNAVGVIGDGPRQLVLLGHIDTVPGEISLRICDGWLHGRGAVDAKGPLAAFVDAAAGARRCPEWQLVVIGAVEEERDSQGARYVADHYHPEYAIIGEPNGWSRVGLGYKGSAWATLTVRRSQAHPAGYQESACEAAISAWQAIQTHVNDKNHDRSRLFDQVLTSLREMQSGGDGFEEWATLQVMTRLPLDLSPTEWYAQLKRIVGPEIHMEPKGFAIPAYQCAKNTQVVRAFLTSIREEGASPGFVLKTGTADLNIVGPAWEEYAHFRGAVVYGPGDSNLDHTPEERIEIDEYLRAIRVLGGAIERLTG